ncbi:MAG TPA: DUF1302 family protein [Stellaceae bacterium]|nr:DUF1302 family protein [Stellaceae bacterium]
MRDAALGFILLLMGADAASAASFDLGDGVRLDWDNDVAGTGSDQEERSLAYHPAGSASAVYQSRDSATGRFDWLSELEISDGDFGIRASARAALGDLYEALGPSDLYVLRYVGSVAAPPGSTRHTDLVPLDAFVHGSFPIDGDGRLSFRIGRHSLLWGESIYFPENGIAAGQAPIDATQFEPISGYQPALPTLPVGQISASYQAGGGLSLEGYWQFEYRASRISAIGSYDVPNALLAPADLARLIAVPADADADAFRFAPSQTEEPSPIGQFGLAVRWRVGDVDLGLYGERWTAKTPTIFLHIPGPGYGTPGTYDLLYPDGIETIGASAAFHLGDANLGAEISGRRGMPLVTAGVVVPSGSSDLALQPIGDTFHAQLSFLYTTPPLPLIAAGATWTGEIALNDVLSAANAPEIMPGRTRFAAAFRTVFEPQFYQVVPRLDLSVPIGIGYGLIGSSETDPTMTRRTGDISVGLTARFDQVWRAGIEFTHYLGRDQVPYLPFQPNDAIDPVAAGDFLSLSVERKF